MKSFNTKTIKARVTRFGDIIVSAPNEDVIAINSKRVARALGEWLLKAAEPEKKPAKAKKFTNFIDWLESDGGLVSDCGDSKRYKGVRQPTCMGGDGCYACWDKYWERNEL